MISKMKTTAGILAAAFLLMGSAVSLSLSVSSDVGGLNQEINADRDDSFFGRVVLSESALSNEIISSRGSLKDRHWIIDDFGDKAEVGVDIRNADWYRYSYTLGNGPDFASAEETIDAADARSIKAYSKTISQQGDVAESSIIISDRNKEASLFGYSNYAYAGSGIYSVAGQIIDSATGDHITINERAFQSDGDTALARMNIDDGQVDSYYGAAVAGIGEYGDNYDFGYESGYWGGSWDEARANHYGTISGKSIDITEAASRPDGELAWAKTEIQKGHIDGYNGNASAANEYHINNGTRYGTDFLNEQWLDTTWVSHGATDLSGKKVAMKEGIIQVDGDIAGASLRAHGIPKVENVPNPYFGGAEAVILSSNSWDGYRLCNGSSNYVRSYHFGDIIGERIDLDEWSRRADGDRASTNARIIDGYTGYNASAGTEIGSNVCIDPMSVTVEVTDITWAYQSLAGLNGRKMDLTAMAVSNEGPDRSVRLRLKPTEDGNYLTSSSAEAFHEDSSAWIFVDWLPKF
jgi:hypothetical protein